MSRLRKLALAAGAALIVTAAGCGATLRLLSEPLPTPAQAADGEADALAHAIEASVDTAAWSRTGAVSWGFGGRTEHLWDRQRHLDRVRWGDNEVLLDITKKTGRATVGGEPVHGAEADKLFEAAFAHWANDSFWLNPLAKLFDDGTTRSIVALEGGGEGLLLSYSSGGVTPGDSYLWILGEDGRPAAWKMWVSIIPIGGVETSWEGWTQLQTGAWVSATHHGAMGFTLELTDIRGAATLAELTGGEDPFAPLLSP